MNFQYDPNKRSNHVKTQLLDIIESKYLKQFKRFENLFHIQPEEDISMDEENLTCLHVASQSAADDIILHILQKSFKRSSDFCIQMINSKTNDESNTPLMLAATNNNLTTAKLLIRLGGIKLFERNSENKRAFDLAAASGYAELANYIKKQMEPFQKDAPKDALTPLNVTELTEVVDYGPGQAEVKHMNNLLKKGLKKGCIVCEKNNGWVKYTKCCGKPIHFMCGRELKKCPDCQCRIFRIMNEIQDPKKAFELDAHGK